MTGYRSKFFRHQCRSAGCYIDGLPCWDDLIEAFPRKIRPTDVDGFVEINGHFLFLEEKQEGKPLEEGQRIALKRLADLPGVTVVFFRPRADGLQTLILDGTTELRGWVDCTYGQFYAWLRKWARNADALQGGAA